MNWVKYGSETGTGDSSGGFSGPKPAGSGAAAPATPKPAATPTPPATPPVNAKPAQPQWGPQLGGGDMFQQMLSNFGTPQGFGQAAGMMPGVFQGVSQLGGLPALMGIYQQMKSMRGGVGANDWSILTNPNYQKAAAAGDEAPTPAAPGLAVQPEPAPEAHPYRTIATNLGMDLARREAMYQGLKHTAGIWGPRLGAQAAKRLPGWASAFLLDTPLNAIDDLGDLGGVLPHWAGGKGDTLWFKSDRDPEGRLQYDESANLQGRYGWNPSAFGNWDMKQFNEDTTPTNQWGFGFGHTGNQAADESLSYLGSGFNAYNHPFKSMYSMGKFQYHDMNPFRDWEAMANPSLLSRPSYHPVSIPGILAQNAVLDPSKPAPAFQPGGKYFDNEKQHWAGRYHPVYNPTESTGRPWYASLGL